MVNICELLINVVTFEEPKMLIGFVQKESGLVSFFSVTIRRLNCHRQIGRT